MKPAWIIGFVALCACGNAAAVPETPDLSVLKGQYDVPTAVLDPESADSALSGMPSLQRLAAGFRAAAYATRGVDSASDSAGKNDEDGLELQGSVRITLRCPGDLEEPAFDADKNGTMAFTVGIEKSAILSGVGGRASNCVLRGEDSGGLPIRVEVDGPIEFDLGGDVSLKNHWSGRLLMKIEGHIRIGDTDLENLSARFTREKFEYLFGLANHEWIIAELTSDGVSLRDANGTWLCQDGQQCGI